MNETEHQLPELVEEKVFEYGVVTDADGNITHNALQQDDPIVRRKYSDGVMVLRGQRSGRLLRPPYWVNHVGEARPPCEHWKEPDASNGV
jgi:hypothetical protein